MSKSAKKIVLALSSFSSLSQKEIQKLTGLSTRSVKGSLMFLKENNFIKELVVLQDMRCKAYRLRGVIHER